MEAAAEQDRGVRCEKRRREGWRVNLVVSERARTHLRVEGQRHTSRRHGGLRVRSANGFFSRPNVDGNGVQQLRLPCCRLVAVHTHAHTQLPLFIRTKLSCDMRRRRYGVD